LILAARCGATDKAERLAQDALRLHHTLGASNGIYAVLEHLAYVAAATGELERAACLLGTAATIGSPPASIPPDNGATGARMTRRTACGCLSARAPSTSRSSPASG
jgi:hypothetical protein